MNISLIITTYNRPDALQVVLRGVAQQIKAPFEVLIADDGSGEETRRCVEHWQAHLPIPLHHIWHEDQGFRAAAIRNRAAAQARGDYLIFIDGDCIPPTYFISAHAHLAQRGYFVTGNRVLLSPRLTKRVIADQDDVLKWSWWTWLTARLNGDVNRLLPLFRLPDGSWRRRQAQSWQGARTCNMGLWREDFVRINGLDESYTGWGHEDADLAVRLMRSGIKRKDGRYALPVFHLWHSENSRGNEAANCARLQETLDGQRPLRAALGLDQYLP